MLYMKIGYLNRIKCFEINLQRGIGMRFYFGNNEGQKF